MEELIKIKEENGRRAVSARELHNFLGSKQDFSTWIKNRIEKYGFNENVDYQPFHKFVECQNGIGGTHRIEYALSIDMAKELSMIENNEKGRMARKYFIACEKELKQINQKPMPKTYLEALKALVASEEEKLMLQEKSQTLEKDNKHKSDVIEGLLYDIPVADMRQRINQIVLKDGSSDIRGKWIMLYDEFDRKYHMKVSTRMTNSGYEGTRMDYIDKELHMITELYDLACKLFESSYEQLMEPWGKYAKRAERYKSQA